MGFITFPQDWNGICGAALRLNCRSGKPGGRKSMPARNRSRTLREQRARFYAQLERLVDAGVLSTAEVDEALHRLARLSILGAYSGS
jgi:hypothetical protein